MTGSIIGSFVHTHYISPGSDPLTGEETKVPVPLGVVVVSPENPNPVGPCGGALALGAQVRLLEPITSESAAAVVLDEHEMLRVLNGATPEHCYDALMAGSLVCEVLGRFKDLDNALTDVQAQLRSPALALQPNPTNSADPNLDHIANGIGLNFNNLDFRKKVMVDRGDRHRVKSLVELVSGPASSILKRGERNELVGLEVYQLFTKNQQFYGSSLLSLGNLIELLFVARQAGINRHEQGSDIKDSAENALRLVHSMIEDIKLAKAPSAQ